MPLFTVIWLTISGVSLNLIYHKHGAVDWYYLALFGFVVMWVIVLVVYLINEDHKASIYINNYDHDFIDIPISRDVV